jgi:hypothetical protein
MKIKLLYDKAAWLIENGAPPSECDTYHAVADLNRGNMPDGLWAWTIKRLNIYGQNEPYAFSSAHNVGEPTWAPNQTPETAVAAHRRARIQLQAERIAEAIKKVLQLTQDLDKVHPVVKQLVPIEMVTEGLTPEEATKYRQRVDSSLRAFDFEGMPVAVSGGSVVPLYLQPLDEEDAPADALATLRGLEATYKEKLEKVNKTFEVNLANAQRANVARIRLKILQSIKDSEAAKANKDKEVEERRKKRLETGTVVIEFGGRGPEWSAPWGAIADLDAAGNLSYDFDKASFEGEPRDGGTLTIKAVPGDIVVYGQKNYKKSRLSSSYLQILNEDGSLSDTSRTVARNRLKKLRNK